jgi:RNA-directed DNA polymerase
MDTRAWAANNLAARLLAKPWTPQAIAATIDTLLASVHKRTRFALVSRLFALGQGTYPPAPHALTAFLVGSEFFKPPPGRPVAIMLDAPRFAPMQPFADLRIPALATPGDLADWLGQSPEQLDWLADERRGHGRAVKSPLQHYRYAFISKRSGMPRLIEAPKPRLKAIQRRILRQILSVVPVHHSANGFVAGRSCLSGAQLHAGECVVATFDLAQFFPSIVLGRVHGLFRGLGYPWAVARRLAGLCTTITPASVFLRLPECQRPDRGLQALFGVPHLPQGAPTSPVLANLLAWRFDAGCTGWPAPPERITQDMPMTSPSREIRISRTVLAASAKRSGQFSMKRDSSSTPRRRGLCLVAHGSALPASWSTSIAILGGPSSIR